MKNIDRSKSSSSTTVIIQLLVFFGYLVFGALVFQALEIDNEKEEREKLILTKVRLQEKYNVSEEDIEKFMRLVQMNADQGFSSEWVDRNLLSWNAFQKAQCGIDTFLGINNNSLILRVLLRVSTAIPNVYKPMINEIELVNIVWQSDKRWKVEYSDYID